MKNIIILTVSLALSLYGTYTYMQGQSALKLAGSWVEETAVRIDTAQAQLADMKATCARWTEQDYVD